MRAPCDLFAAFHELASASARTLLKLASSVRALKTLSRHLKEARKGFFVDVVFAKRLKITKKDI